MVVAIMNHRRKGKKGYTVSYLLSFVIFIGSCHQRMKFIEKEISDVYFLREMRTKKKIKKDLFSSTQRNLEKDIVRRQKCLSTWGFT